MEQVSISVGECVSLVNQTLEYAFPTLIVEGEVASFKVNQGKYVFFDLKDEEATIGCFMMIFSLRVPLEDGMRVRVQASPKLTQWGKFSLTVREVWPVGEGSLKRAFDLLYAKLDKEGLFAEERKRLLPQLPARIGVISSKDAAGYKDFMTILGQRWGGIDIQVAHVQVQGTGAPQQIIRALNYFNEQADPVEIVAIVRGGGSADDLAAFNDEPLVRAIAASRIPTIVGVGHEVDTSLADLVADVRAATPSNAAEILVPDKREIEANVTHLVGGMIRSLEAKVSRMYHTVELQMRTVGAILDQQSTRVTNKFRSLDAVLTQLNPRTALRRGYALVRDSGGGMIRSQEVKKGDMLGIETEKYHIKTEVKDVERKNT